MLPDMEEKGVVRIKAFFFRRHESGIYLIIFGCLDQSDSWAVSERGSSARRAAGCRNRRRAERAICQSMRGGNVQN